MKVEYVEMSAEVAATPAKLKLNNRPFHLGQLNEFVYHCPVDTEFVALAGDDREDEYGGITRLQMLMLLNLVELPDCEVCGSNHGKHKS